MAIMKLTCLLFTQAAAVSPRALIRTVFAMMEPSAAVESASKLASQSARSPPSESDAIGFVLRTGGLASIVASYFAFRLAHKHKVLLDG